MKKLFFIVAAAFSLTIPAMASEVLVVSGEAITSSTSANRYVKVGERLPVFELKKRFKGLTVQSTAGEDCMFCAYVSGSEIAFEVNYDETGVVVTSVVCHQGCSDALGNEVGTKLQSAVGNEANCDAGYYTTCLSPRIQGLNYILGDAGDNCSFSVLGQSTRIPECALIGGFILQGAVEQVRSEDSESSSAGSESASSLQRTRANGPSFSKFPVQQLYKGATKLPDFSGRDRKYRDYRTRIREGLKSGPNMAGEYSVIQIGCGTGCSFAYIARNRNGQVYDFPRGGEENMYMQILTRLDSRLIVVQWGSYDLNACVVEFFEWTGLIAKPLSKTQIGDLDACYEDIQANLAQN